MLCSVDENKLTLYKVEVNEQELLKIKRVVEDTCLARILNEIINGNEKYIGYLKPFVEYFEIVKLSSPEKYEEFTKKYKDFIDVNGYQYINEILENIKLILLYESTYTDRRDLLTKLYENGDDKIKYSITSIKDSLVPDDLLKKDTDDVKTKKIGVINNG